MSPLTIDEAIEQLTDIKREIGGDAWLVTEGDSLYIREFEGCPEEPGAKGACILYGRPGENPDDCTTHGHETEPPERAVVVCWMGDFASDAEEWAERQADRR